MKKVTPHEIKLDNPLTGAPKLVLSRQCDVGLWGGGWLAKKFVVKGVSNAGRPFAGGLRVSSLIRGSTRCGRLKK